MFLNHKFFLLIFSLLLLSACGRSADPLNPTPTETQAVVVAPTETPQPTSVPTATPVPTQTPEEVASTEGGAIGVDETVDDETTDLAVGDAATVDNAPDDVADTEDAAEATDDEAIDSEGGDATTVDIATDNVADVEDAAEATDDEAVDSEEDNTTSIDSAADEVAGTEEDASTADDGADEAATEVAEIPYMGRPPEELWASLACSACHQLDQDQTDANRGPVGPHQGNLAERITIIAPDQEPEEYVYTSIIDPDAYVVESYFPGIMPQTYADQMSEEEIRALAQWMLDSSR